MKQSKQILLLSIILFVVTLGAYYPAWNGTPIWDDDHHITRPELRSLDGLGRIWAELGATQQYYPLVHSAFWLAYHVWGDSPLGYHLLNILLHFLSALLLVSILRFLKIPGAWLAAAIFALHPVQVESVAWISEFKNTLSGVFFFATAFVYLKFNQNGKKRLYAIAIGLFILGLLSKSVIATLPVSLLAIFWWQRGRISWNQDVVPLIPFFIVGLSSGLFTAWIERKFIGAEGGEFDLSFIERCLIAGRAFWFYLSKIFWPADLVFIYPQWNVSHAVWWQYLFPVSFLILAGAFWTLRKHSRAPMAVFILFSATIFPVMGFFNVYPFRFSFVADHFQYLASIGPIALLAAGTNRMFDLSTETVRRFLKPLILVIVLLCLGMLTWRQSGTYSNAETIYRTTIKKNPLCWMAHNNLGLLLAGAGRNDEAFSHYRTALEINPDYYKALINLGILLAKTGKIDDALMNYRKAVEVNPNNAAAYSNIGNLFAQTGRGDEAFAQYRKALEVNPNNGETNYNFGLLLAKVGRTEEAIVHYKKALDINHGYYEAHNNLGNALLRVGRIEEAIEHYQKAIDIAPRYDVAHYNLGNALLRTNRIDKAIFHYRKALEIRPAEIRVIQSLAFALLQKGQPASAIELLEKALALSERSGNEAQVKAIEQILENLRSSNIPVPANPPDRLQP
jgi:tetratricopeptide (TPR) repeat protein